jgi:hypothetical protein
MPLPKKTLRTASLLGAGLLSLPSIGLTIDLPSVSVGAGMRTSFTETDRPGSANDSSDFTLDSARIYLSGKVMDNLSFMLNTEYNGSSVDVMDAAAQFSFSDAVNIWAGRFLPPSDRANLYGPYYASNWGVYQDGVQDGYPFITTGRDDGVMYWGQFGITKVSLGAFDIPSTLGNKDVLYAGRVQFDFWDPEAGYYLNGTYYGEKDLLALGLAAQSAAGDKAYSADFLLEKKLPNAGVVTLEAEYAKYDGLGGYTGRKSDGYYGLAGYLFPAPVGPGRFQALAKYGTTTYTVGSGTGPSSKVDHDTLELDLNYILKAFNARISLFYIDKDYTGTASDARKFGLGLQIQM